MPGFHVIRRNTGLKGISISSISFTHPVSGKRFFFETAIPDLFTRFVGRIDATPACCNMRFIANRFRFPLRRRVSDDLRFVPLRTGAEQVREF